MIKLPKVLICDIDGTISARTDCLNENIRYVFEQLHSKGVKIGLASGRPLYQIKQTAECYNLSFDFDFYIMMNGASYYDNITKEKTSISILKKDVVKDIINLMKPYEVNCNCCVYTETEMVVRNNTEWMQEYWYKDRKDVRVEKEDEFYYADDREKLMYRFFEPSQLDECFKELDKNKYDDFDYFRTQPDHLEFGTKTTNKKYALIEYCKKYDIDLKDVCACGDTTNDNGMIEISGVGVCLQNGTDDTKAISDYVTEKPVTEDGLGLFLRELYKGCLEGGN